MGARKCSTSPLTSRVAFCEPVSLLCVGLCGMLRAGWSGQQLELLLLHLCDCQGIEGWWRGGYTGAARGADVYCCQPTRSLQSTRAEVEVMMLPPSPPPPYDVAVDDSLPSVLFSISVGQQHSLSLVSFRAASICVVFTQEPPLAK